MDTKHLYVKHLASSFTFSVIFFSWREASNLNCIFDHSKIIINRCAQLNNKQQDKFFMEMPVLVTNFKQLFLPNKDEF